MPTYLEKGAHLGEELPRFVRDLVASPPARGEGLNLWFYKVARLLHAFRSKSEIEDLLSAAVAGQSVKQNEILRAIERSEATAWDPEATRGSTGSVQGERPRLWPVVNSEQREAIIAGGDGLVDLWEMSPVRFNDSAPHTEEVIDALFPGNPLLCIGQSNSLFATRRREALRGRLSESQLIVPSPMTQGIGRTQEGKPSEHSLENTGPRRFLVVEQDAGTSDEQAAVLLHLAKKGPLAAAVHSGSKSIHGWFVVAGRSEERNRAFMELAVSLGADRATWTRSQFVRMPGGRRDNGNPQTIYFFNPAVIPL